MDVPLSGNMQASGGPLVHSALLPLLLVSLVKQKNSPEVTDKIKKEYDYVIVGGGAAGSVVAARLSELPCVSVLLLEAGGKPPILTEVPGLNPQFLTSDIDWNQKTAPQKHTGYGLLNNQLSWPAGKALGGSSVISTGSHIVGNRADYDGWASAGAKGWSYKEVLPFFKKLEDNRIPEYVADGYHGVGGPITVENPRYEPEIQGALFHAARSLGYQMTDPNGKRQTGFFYPLSNLRNNVRCSTAKAYLVPAENRKNLDIVANAFVRKIVIEEGRAEGVLFDLGGKAYTVGARREVILSAGAVNSAQILMLSGVGPEEELKKFHIPVHADLPVGFNFQDHAGSTLDFVLSPRIRPLQEKLMDPESVKTFIHNRTGPLASTDGITNMAFVLNKETDPKVDLPNIEIHFVEDAFVNQPGRRNIKPEVYKKVFAPYEQHAKLSCLVNSVRPRSRGRVTLKSANPYVSPLIDPNYFADPKDLEETVQGMKACKRIVLSPAMKKLGVEPFQTVYPGCEKYEQSEDAYFRCIAQTVLYTLSHPSGTAKMGHPSDPTTVVDPQLRVKHIHGLRVVDNSIMPAIISGNTLAPAIMIGEKASAMIRESIDCHPHEGDYHQDGIKLHEDGLYGSSHDGASYSYPIQPQVYDGKKGQHEDGSSYISASYGDHDKYSPEKYGKKVVLGDARLGYGSSPYEGPGDYSPEKYSKKVLLNDGHGYDSTSFGGHDDYSPEEDDKTVLRDAGLGHGSSGYEDHDEYTPGKYSKKFILDGGLRSTGYDDYSPEKYGKTVLRNGGHSYESTPFGVHDDYSTEKKSKKVLLEAGLNYGSNPYRGYDDYSLEKDSTKVLGEGVLGHGSTPFEGRDEYNRKKNIEKILHESGRKYGNNPRGGHYDYSPDFNYRKKVHLKGGSIYGSTPYGVRDDYSPEKEYDSKLHAYSADQDDYRMKMVSRDSDRISVVAKNPVSVVERFGPTFALNKPVRVY